MVYDGILIGLFVGFIRAGFLNGLIALSNVRIKGGLIFPVLLILQFAVFYIQEKVQFIADISGYFFIVVYIAGLVLLWFNRKEKGFGFILLGVALNFLVMLVNGGRMPVSLEAASVLDPIYLEMLQSGSTVAKHFLLDSTTHLPFLGDIIPLSSPYPRTQAISVGDVIMNFGIFIYIQKIMLDQKIHTSLVET